MHMKILKKIRNHDLVHTNKKAHRPDVDDPSIIVTPPSKNLFKKNSKFR